MHMLHRIHMSCYIEYTMHIHDAHATHHTHTHVCTITRATQHTHAHATHHTHTHAHATHHTHTHTHAKHHTPRKKKSRMTQSEGEWVSEWVSEGRVSECTHTPRKKKSHTSACVYISAACTRQHTKTYDHQHRTYIHTSGMYAPAPKQQNTGTSTKKYVHQHRTHTPEQTRKKKCTHQHT